MGLWTLVRDYTSHPLHPKTELTVKRLNTIPQIFIKPVKRLVSSSATKCVNMRVCVCVQQLITKEVKCARGMTGSLREGVTEGREEKQGGEQGMEIRVSQ